MVDPRKPKAPRVPDDPSQARRLASAEPPSGETKISGAGRALSPRVHELGKSFLSALFMAFRTAQIHDAQNTAFQRAVQALSSAAELLYRATGAYSLAFVDESVFLNGTRLRLEGGMFTAARSLRSMLESREMGGLEIRTPPSFESMRKLVLVFAPQGAAESANREDLLAEQIRALGVQRFQDRSRETARIDRRLFALQAYAKLILAFREQAEGAPSGARVKVVRVVQDLIELCSDRMDFLLRIGSNHSGAAPDELHAANVCVLSLALGHCLGLPRSALVDLGVGALLHDVGRSAAVDMGMPLPEPAPGEVHLIEEEAAGPPTLRLDEVEELQFVDDTERAGVGPELPPFELPEESLLPEGLDADILDRADRGAVLVAQHPEEALGAADPPHRLRGFVRLLGAGGVGRPGLARALVAAEHHAAGTAAWRPHVYGRVAAVADAYDALTAGLGDGRPRAPLDALQAMRADATGRLDPDLLDLLINALRAFPAGVEVVLDDGRRAEVVSHAGSSRWDRPVVRLADGPVVDLMMREQGRFAARIAGTERFLERLDEVHPLELSEDDLVVPTLAESDLSLAPPEPDEDA